MATDKKPTKRGTVPVPGYPKLSETQEDDYPPFVEPTGDFQLKGQAAWDGEGVMMIDEDGDLTDDGEEDVAQTAEDEAGYRRSVGIDENGNPVRKTLS
jgi:hypothetical protein